MSDGPEMVRLGELMQLRARIGDGYEPRAGLTSELAPVIRECLRIADERKRALAIVIVLCGTSGDPQSVVHQRTTLESAGAFVVRSNAQAALIAVALARGDLSLV